MGKKKKREEESGDKMKYILSLFLTALMCSSLTAQFSEVSNQREFSGSMICRPTPGNLLAAQAILPNSVTVQSTGQIYFPLQPGDTENSCYAELMGMGIFEYVEPDWTVFLTAIPNDNYYAQQWHHQVIGSEAGWELTTGDPSIVVAICDTGMDFHNDLNNHLDAYNATTQLFESEGGDTSAIHYHGTATTGVAAATGNNSIGVAGVGWNLSKRMLRVSEVASGSTTLSVLQHAVRVAAEQGDHCISVSYSGVDSVSNLTVAEYARELGSLVFWSAGNDGRRLDLGQRDLDKLIVCGATGSTDVKAGFSAYGPFMDMTAPGTGIWTTSLGNNGNTYGAPSGTSFSAPMIAGVAALIWSLDPTLTPDEIELLLKVGATDKGDIGTDETYGHGRLSLQGSLELVGGPSIHTFTANNVTAPYQGNGLISITIDNPEPIYGFSFGLQHDPAAVTPNLVSVGNDIGTPDYFHYEIHTGSVAGVTVGAVMSLSGPLATIPPGNWHAVYISYVAEGDSDIVFSNAVGTPPVDTEVATVNGAVTPHVVHGGIDVSTVFRRGDSNGDGHVSLSDAVHILLHLFNSGPIQCQDASDVDDNGALNLADVMTSLSYTMTGGQAPPAPFDTCAGDTTSDNLICVSFSGC